jgi:anti-anti-sigma factor
MPRPLVHELAAVRIMQEGPVVIVSLEGEVDLSNVQEIRDQLLRAVPNTATALILNLTEARYLDSQGVGMLLDVTHRLSMREQRLLLVTPKHTPVWSLLEVLSVPTAIPVVDTMQEGVRRLADLTS